ncbi:unnamed protein product [Protopolystoma xenopodis]|uniref:Uncharacterized protein n=1 Tax=Protopolystoma xenopodis TaxID=117903 RepID=A0A3S5C7A3_9PLAT|nr:unnamed protein product [Protopolystoma xenopodis]
MVQADPCFTSLVDLPAQLIHNFLGVSCRFKLALQLSSDKQASTRASLPPVSTAGLELMPCTSSRKGFVSDDWLCKRNFLRLICLLSLPTPQGTD